MGKYSIIVTQLGLGLWVGSLKRKRNPEIHDDIAFAGTKKRLPSDIFRDRIKQLEPVNRTS